MRMTDRRFAKLFGGPAREPETEITQREMDIAASIQKATETIILKMVNHVCRETNQNKLCMAGLRQTPLNTQSPQLRLKIGIT